MPRDPPWPVRGQAPGIVDFVPHVDFSTWRIPELAMRMPWLGWIVLALALVEGGWLAFDGAHALVTGDYVTPKAGRHAGQLGPWSALVRAVGLEPRSTLVKAIHLALGSVWLAVTVGFALRFPWAWAGMLACAAAGLWYLPFGTLSSVIQIWLLLLPALRPSP